MKNIFLLLRPQQWMKNGFVFLPLFFSGNLCNTSMLLQTLIAFLSYSLAASSIYCFNDIYDREADRLHPKKRLRPVASGVVSVAKAYVLMLFVLLLSLLVAFFGLTAWREACFIIGFYYVMNLAYCIRLKQIALVDVVIIAVGFVLRVVLGGAVTGIVLSHWIVVMTFLLALFLAFAKRRDDVVLYENTGVLPRRNVNRYNLQFMNQTIAVIASITLVAYMMYTVSDEVMERLGSHRIYITAIFVLMGILRYMQLTIVDVKSGSPTKVLMHDRFVQACIVGWCISFLILIYL